MGIVDVYRAARDPNSLYAAALGAIGLSPEAQAILSPAGAQIFSAVYGAAAAAAGPALGELGAAALAEATALVGPSVVAGVGAVASGVASAVGSALPIVNLFVSIIQIAEAMPHARGASIDWESECALAWRTPPGASGPADRVSGVTATTPADLFASTDTDPSRRMPQSSLGAALVGVTESWEPPGSSNADGRDPMFGGPRSALELGLLTSGYRGNLRGVVPRAELAGIPKAHRQVFRALRYAIASNGVDHGVAPYCLWLDMLAGEYDAGRMSTPFAAYLLANRVRWLDMHGSTIPRVEPTQCPGAYAQGAAAQITALVDSWRAARVKVKRITLSPAARASLLDRLAAGRPRPMLIGPIHVASVLPRHHAAVLGVGLAGAAALAWRVLR